MAWRTRRRPTRGREQVLPVLGNHREFTFPSHDDEVLGDEHRNLSENVVLDGPEGSLHVVETDDELVVGGVDLQQFEGGLQAKKFIQKFFQNVSGKR
jgi:hypothetical protein